MVSVKSPNPCALSKLKGKLGGAEKTVLKTPCLCEYHHLWTVLYQNNYKFYPAFELVVWCNLFVNSEI